MGFFHDLPHCANVSGKNGLMRPMNVGIFGKPYGKDPAPKAGFDMANAKTRKKAPSGSLILSVLKFAYQIFRDLFL